MSIQRNVTILWKHDRCVIVTGLCSLVKAQPKLKTEKHGFAFFAAKQELRLTGYVGAHPNDRKLTAFEANGKLLQFKRVPFGLTNAVEAFQRVVAQIIDEDKLTGIYPYLDDVTTAGNTLEEIKDRSQTIYVLS